MSEISKRKKEHLELAADPKSQSQVTPGWEDVHLVASSLPKVDLADVEIGLELCGNRLEAPFIISSMTGGHADARPINESLALAAQQLGVAIGSGSQRAALRHPELASTYEIIRLAAPDAVVLANIGVCQLVDQGDEPALTRDEIDTAIGMLDAQFLTVHLNAIEEVIQPEGDTHLSGLLNSLEKVVLDSSVPVVAKETGSGMSREIALQLVEAGIEVLDVGGAGGTSFARIEGQRAAQQGNERATRIGLTFGDWGIPTAASILEVRNSGVPSVATGGVRSGLDAAKAIALGASAVGVGRPVLKAALEGPDAVIGELSALIEEMKLAVLLTGCANLDDLRSHDPVLTGYTREWAEQRGLL